MKELTQQKKLEILRLFLAGYTFDQIATESDVGKGSVVNVVNDFRAGRFPAFADVAELVDALRELSVELRKKGAGVSEALLGAAFFFRLSEMGITPDKVWLWADMCREMSPPEAPLQQFTAAALELFRLAKETGESYDSVAAKWSELRAESERLGQEVKDLESKKKELETTQAVLTEECQRVTEEKRGLEKDAGELSTRCEVMRKEISQLEASRQLLNGEVGELSDKVGVLQPEVEALVGLGFGKDELETLRVKLAEMASSQSLTPEALRTRFFQDLSEYGAIVSFRRKREELEGEVASLQAQKESLEQVMSRLGLPPEEVEEAVKSLVALKKKGVPPSTVASYYRVLSQSGLEPSEVEKEILELGGLKRDIASHMKESKRLEEEEHKRSRVMEALRAEETAVKATIRALKQSGIKEVKEASLAVTEEVRRIDRGFLEDVRKWGDIKAEIGKHEAELKLVRYFAKLPLSREALAALVEELPLLVIAQYLTIALVWCREKFNPKTRQPQEIRRKYYDIGQYTDVELADLLVWSLIAITAGGAYGSR